MTRRAAQCQNGLFRQRRRPQRPKAEVPGGAREDELIKEERAYVVGIGG